jgi:ABC-type dipeptide/oligopeptide/nickel transport system ATPase component
MMCDYTIVLRNGGIIEQGESRALFDNPQTAYTRELVEAVPHIGRAPAERSGVVLEDGESVHHSGRG